MSPQRPTDVTPIERWDRLLDGQVAVVTGGGEGIGAAVALLFARHGARVEIAEIDADRAHRSRQAVEEAGGTARASVTETTAEGDSSRTRRATPLSSPGEADSSGSALRHRGPRRRTRVYSRSSDTPAVSP